MKINNVSIIGMGALGVMYGYHFVKHIGAERVQFIADEERIQRYANCKLTCNQEPVQFNLVCSKEAMPADLLIVAVKDSGLLGALDTMKQAVGKDTIIISVMNGITSEDIIQARYSNNSIIHTVAQGMDAKKLGDDLEYSHMGELRIGIVSEENRVALENLVAFFNEAKFPYVVEEDILFRLWCKLMANVGVNQVTAAYQVNYGELFASQEKLDVMVGAMREVMYIANKKGIAVSEDEVETYFNLMKTFAPDSMPSMCQDVLQGRKTEVDMFAGTVIRLGKEVGVETPFNEFLYEKLTT